MSPYMGSQARIPFNRLGLNIQRHEDTRTRGHEGVIVRNEVVETLVCLRRETGGVPEIQEHPFQTNTPETPP
jgi:hypothetical protein